jgi:hypothetical protein|tara:strand:- start:12035 stop:12601 length:567 start_codon:yes stop_codon:yes gene_type:complete|mmetsp:Transcript_8964/g.29917  ORF Transcript_8964/g.29917 Transcript_8964/m.29917 type:complete len:189 (-) Transcript_8964:868-1434(-)
MSVSPDVAPKRKAGMDMASLVTHTKSCDVPETFVESAKDWPLWDSETQKQEPLGSGKFPFNYNGDYATERVLIISGKATLAPDDGSAEIVLETGDSVYFHHGFACQWTVHEVMTKRYNYFDKDGALKTPAAIACDKCGADCEAESYLVNGEEDVCPECYVNEKLTGGEHQKFGEPVQVEVQTKKAKKK